MDTQAEQILQTALGLHPNDRAEIAASLVQSLDEGVDRDVDVAGAGEISLRTHAIDAGQVQLVPWDEVFSAMRERLNA